MVVAGGDVNHALHRTDSQAVRADGGSTVVAADVQLHWRDDARIAVLFAMVERCEQHLATFIRQAECETVRVPPTGCHERHDPTRRVRHAAMVVGTLPEAAHPAVQTRRAPLDEGKAGTPQQRAVAEQPIAHAGPARLTVSGAW